MILVFVLSFREEEKGLFGKEAQMSFFLITTKQIVRAMHIFSHLKPRSHNSVFFNLKRLDRKEKLFHHTVKVSHFFFLFSAR